MRINLNAKILIVILGLIIVANSILGFIAHQVSDSALTKSVNNSLNLMAQNLSIQITDMNNQELTILHTLAKLDTISSESATLEEKSQELKNIKDLDPAKYENVAFYDANGFSLVGDGRKMDFSSKDYFMSAIKGEDFISDPRFSTVNNQVLQFYAVPVYGSTSKKIIGTITSVIKGDRLTNLVKTIDTGAGFHPAILNRTTGTTIANANSGTNDDNLNIKDLDPKSSLGKIFFNLLSGSQGSDLFYDPAIKMKMTASYCPVKGTTWSIFCVAPYDVYYAGLSLLNRLLLIGIFVSIIIAFLIGFFSIGALTKPLVSVKNSIVDIASGNADLTKRLPAATNDEIGDVVNGFNQFTQKLQSIMKELKASKDELNIAGEDLGASTQDTDNSINEIIANIETIHTQISNQADSVTETAGAVNQIASNIESLERMIETQSRGVSEASNAVETMIGNINSVNYSMDKMAFSFEQLAQNAQNGSSLQSDANEKIQRIKNQSETLQEANLAIAAIAEQTNLLAMNAAIEAAHAGEAGKGFSVVADEIRKLSETSSQQSKTIGTELNEIRESIESMVQASFESSEAFNSVTAKIAETDQLVKQIKAAMEEQTEGSNLISQALNSMNDSTMEVKTASREMSEGNKQILSEVKNLQDATGLMKSSMEEMSSGAKKINETGIALQEISKKLKNNISEIGNQIDQFKI